MDQIGIGRKEGRRERRKEGREGERKKGIEVR